MADVLALPQAGGPPPESILNAVSPDTADLRQVYTNVGNALHILLQIIDSMRQVTGEPLRKAMEAKSVTLLGDEAHKLAGKLAYVCAHSTVAALQAVSTTCRSAENAGTHNTDQCPELRELAGSACEAVESLAAALTTVDIGTIGSQTHVTA